MSGIEEAGLDVAAGFKATPGRLYIRLTDNDLETSKELIRELIRRAAAMYRSVTVAGQTALVTAIAPDLGAVSEEGGLPGRLRTAAWTAASCGAETSAASDLDF